MIHKVGNISEIHTSINDYFNTFKADILKYSRLSWKEEDLKEKSYQQWKVMQYYNLLYYLLIVHNDVVLLGNSQTWSYFVDKYKLRDIKDCVACEGIDFKSALAIFNLPSSVDGIETMEVEQTLQVVGEAYPTSSFTIKELIVMSATCVNYIQAGVDPGIPVGGDENFDTIQDTITENDGEVADPE